MALKLWLSAGAFVALTTHLAYSKIVTSRFFTFSDRFSALSGIANFTCVYMRNICQYDSGE
jgi:hypothetical protein